MQYDFHLTINYISEKERHVGSNFSYTRMTIEYDQLYRVDRPLATVRLLEIDKSCRALTIVPETRSDFAMPNVQYI